MNDAPNVSQDLWLFFDAPTQIEAAVSVRQLQFSGVMPMATADKTQADPTTVNDMPGEDQASENPIAVFSDHAGPVCRHNFDGDKQRQWQLSCLATGAETKKGETIVNQDFNLKYWYVHPTEVTNDDGQKVKAVRVVVITDEMDAYGFVSDGLYQSMCVLVEFNGVGPYEPAIKCRISNVSTGKNRFYQIGPAPEKGKK